MSLLQGILLRLSSMKEKGEDQERYFEQNGVKKCKVAYNAKNDSFDLKIYNKDGGTNTFQFDNIDIVAIEIFDLLEQEAEVNEG